MQTPKPPVNCMIVDDEPIARRVIKNYLSRVDGFHISAECSKALDAFQLLQNNPAELLFLDIQMPKLSGLELLKSLHQQPKVIIVSAHREYALEGFELDVLDYLLKPVPFDRFLRALDKFRQTQVQTQAQMQMQAQMQSQMQLRAAQQQLPAASAPGAGAGLETGERSGPGSGLGAAGSLEDSYIFIRADRKTVRLELARILYIESLSDYLKIHTPTHTYLTKEKISVMEEKLPGQFLRIHRSFLINLQHLQAFTPEMAEIAGKELPISRSMRQSVLDILQEK